MKFTKKKKDTDKCSHLFNDVNSKEYMHARGFTIT